MITLKMAAFEAWLAAFTEAWAEKTPDAAAALFTSTGAVHPAPFAPVVRGRNAIRDYWNREVVEGQLNPRIEAAPWIVFDNTGICRLSGRTIVLPENERLDIDAVARVVFRLREGEPLLCDTLSIWSETRARPGV